MIHDLKCKHCGQTFTAKNRNTQFCCRVCWYEDRKAKRQESAICAVCGVSYLRIRKRVCCSDQCHIEHRRRLNRESMRRAALRRKPVTTKCADCIHHVNARCALASAEHRDTNAVALRIMGMCPRRGDVK